MLWWGLFDDQLFVERGDERFGPFYPIGGAIPLHRYRKFKRTKTDERADRIAALAEKLELPRSALSGKPDFEFLTHSIHQPEDDRDNQPAVIRFADPDPFQEFTYPNAISAKRAVAEYLGLPLAKLTATERSFIDSVVAESLNKKMMIERVKNYFRPSRLALPDAELLEEQEEYVN